MYLKENIKFLRSKSSYSQQDIANQLEISRSAWSSYENGTAEPPFKMLYKIAELFKMSISDLLETNLETYKSGSNTYLKGNNLRVLASQVNQNNEETIEMVPIKAKAGYTSGFGDPTFIAELECIHLPFADKRKKYRAFQINGDSMPPASDKSWVIAEYIQNWSTIKDNTLCIFVLKEDGIVFKKCINRIESLNGFILCSTNPIYKPFFVEVAQIAEIWKFSWNINHELPTLGNSKIESDIILNEMQLKILEIELKLNTIK